MRRLLTILLFLAASQSTLGQIFNSISSDRSGMYYYAVDTLIRSLKEVRKIDRIIIKADHSISQIFPDTILGVKITRYATDTKHKRNEIAVSDIVLAVFGVAIIRDQFTISILAVERTKDGMPYIGDGAYKYYFTYEPVTGTYRLTKIKGGIVL